MKRAIVGFHQDEVGDWVAQLSCGHTRHVRHNPPWMNRPWVTSEAGRRSFLGREVYCRTCDDEAGGQSGAGGEELEI